MAIEKTFKEDGVCVLLSLSLKDSGIYIKVILPSGEVLAVVHHSRNQWADASLLDQISGLVGNLGFSAKQWGVLKELLSDARTWLANQKHAKTQILATENSNLSREERRRQRERKSIQKFNLAIVGREAEAIQRVRPHLAHLFAMLCWEVYRPHG